MTLIMRSRSPQNFLKDISMSVWEASRQWLMRYFILGQNFIYLSSLILSILSITLEGRRGTTDEFATIPFHLVLFSAALVELTKSILVHFLILSSHLFFSLPLFLLTVPCRIVFANQKTLKCSQATLVSIS